MEVSGHAIRRYGERVKPALSRRAASAELRQLVALAGEPGERPAWVVESKQARDTDGWLELCDGICCPVRNGCVLTVLTRASMAEEVRSAASRRRRNRRQQRKALNRVGEGQAQRRERKAQPTRERGRR